MTEFKAKGIFVGPMPYGITWLLMPHKHGFKNRTGSAGSIGEWCLVWSDFLKKPEIKKM